MEVSADLDTITVTYDGVIIASHARAWARQLTLTDPTHVAKAAVLRRQFQQLTRHPTGAIEVVETRSLASYDQLFGIDLEPSAPDLLVLS